MEMGMTSKKRYERGGALSDKWKNVCEGKERKKKEGRGFAEGYSKFNFGGSGEREEKKVDFDV